MNAYKDNIPQIGKVELISIRPKKKENPISCDSVKVNPTLGIEGDHYHGKSGKRQVTLIQAEHLLSIASILKKDHIDPLRTRRNIVVSGINLTSLKEKQFKIGNVVLETTGVCAPCGRMEKNFGPGGFNAMRGMGGICAKVINGGEIKKGDLVQVEPSRGTETFD